MNRKTLALTACLAIFALAAVGTASAQIRLDLGVDIPRGFGALSGGEIFTPETVDFLDKTILPFPEVGVYYQWDMEIIKVGVGLRCFTFILETVFWPNAIAELHLGPIALEGQIGGGFFGIFGIVSSTQTGQVFIPDLSVWYEFGDMFKLGIGGIGLFLPELTSDTIPFIWYIGAKFTLNF